jgi:hypothetical protein
VGALIRKRLTLLGFWNHSLKLWKCCKNATKQKKRKKNEKMWCKSHN